jgi:hypothetical protein
MRQLRCTSGLPRPSAIRGVEEEEEEEEEEERNGEERATSAG